MRQLRRNIFIALCLTLSACGGSAATDTGTITDNLLAKQRWAAQRPASYDYTLSVSCFCGKEITVPVVIVVDGSSVISRTYEVTGARVADAWASSFPTIDGLFEKIDGAIAAHAATMDATYDASRGYPTRIAIDYATFVADDEITYTIRDFHVR